MMKPPENDPCHRVNDGSDAVPESANLSVSFPEGRHDVAPMDSTKTDVPEIELFANQAADYLRGLRGVIALTAAEWTARYGLASSKLLCAYFIDGDTQQAERMARIIQVHTTGSRTAQDYVDEFVSYAANALEAYMKLHELEPSWDLREDVAEYIRREPQIISCKSLL